MEDGAPARPYGYVTSAFRTPTEAAFLSVFLRTSHATTRYPNSNDSTKAYRAGLLTSAFTSHQ
jgi:hypothetical protein